MEDALLTAINTQLQETIKQLRRARFEEQQPKLQSLFFMGCGFIEFLENIFSYLPLDQVLICRLVCKTWKEFIDSEVMDRHPDVCLYRKWTQGEGQHHLVYCGGEVATLTADSERVYAALKHGEVLVFDGSHFLLETMLEGRGETVWQLQAGHLIVAAVTQSCVTVWSKPVTAGGSFNVVARIRHGSQGEPYLHVEANIVAIPGDSQHVTRLLVYTPEKNTMKGFRDLSHGRHWVLGAYLEVPRMLTLSLLAWGSATERQLRLWCILSGHCITEVVMPGGVAGFPALRYPHAFLSTASKGLEVWDLRTNNKIRTVEGPVLGYQLHHQFVFLLNGHSKVRVQRLKEITTQEDIDLWSRDVCWPVEGSLTGSLPRLQVQPSRLLSISSTGRSRDTIHVLSVHY